MQRKETQSFATYKEERAAAQAAEKFAKKMARGGTVSSREQLRNNLKANGKLKGVYGEGVRRALNNRASCWAPTRRKNERAFARRIAVSTPEAKPVSARQQRIQRKNFNRLLKLQREAEAV